MADARASRLDESRGVFGGPDAAISQAALPMNESGILVSQNLRLNTESEPLDFSDNPSMGAVLISSFKTSSGQPKTKEKITESKYFAFPTSGMNWGKLHDNNAVDIANACGTPVYASAEGVYIPDDSIKSEDEWNGGYGKFILLEHPNGVRTRYAHLSEIQIEPGQYVSKKQQIGLIGSTGKVKGSNGCHLHFEVLGATNPFAK